MITVQSLLPLPDCPITWVHFKWKRLEPILPPQKPDVGRPNNDHRITINGILWILRTRAPWRDLPKRYGPWGTVSGPFYRWRKQGQWQRIFQALQRQADTQGKINWEIHFVDGTVVRAHQHAAGARRGTLDPNSELSAIEQVQQCKALDWSKGVSALKFTYVVMAMGSQ